MLRQACVILSPSLAQYNRRLQLHFQWGRIVFCGETFLNCMKSDLYLQNYVIFHTTP